MILPPLAADDIQSNTSESLLKTWRQERAHRIGHITARACAVFLIFIIPLDIFYSSPPVYLTDLLFLGGCISSVALSKSKSFFWWPLYLGFWINSLPSIYYAGGLQSPFLGLYMAIYFASATVIQTQIRPFYILIFTGSNFLAWIFMQIFAPTVSPESLPTFFTAPIILIMVSAIIIFVYSFFNTESGLTQEIFKRYQELANTKAELEREELASSAKSSFIANISHELRTPLGAILGYTEILLEKKSNLKEEDQKHLDTVLKNGQKLLRLVDDLLDISKIEAGKIEFETVSFKPRNVLNEVMGLLKISAEKKNLSLSEYTSTTVPENVKSDPLRFQQILLNVIGNAIKFTEQGSVMIFMDYVSLPHSGSGKSRGYLRVQIRDTGRGLTPNEQAKLFKPFSQADASMTRKYGGTGLGLNLAQKMAQAMGGGLELTESRPGEGSIFTFSIAVEPQDPVVTTEASTLNEKKSINESLQGVSILIVDDSSDNQALLQTYLKKAGARTNLASNGADAIQEVEKDRYDLVLMDVQMPVLDGLTATEILRKKGFNKPIIAITAHAMKDDKDRCLASGCNAYLTKPLNRQNLIHTLYSFL